MSVGTAVSYVLSLESKQFLQELAKAKKEARDAAKEIASGTTSAGGGASSAARELNGMADAAGNAAKGAKEAAAGMADLASFGEGANDVMKVFRSTTNAFAQAMSGNLVGAAANAARAVKGLTAAMSANPILLVASAVAGLAMALSSVARRWQEYKERIREARQETEDFLKRLDEMRYGTHSDNYVQGMATAMENALGSGDPELVENQRKAAQERMEAARARAEEAQREVEKWTTAPVKGSAFGFGTFSPNAGYDEDYVKSQLEAAKSARDAAEEEYKNELAVLEKYSALIAANKAAEEEAAEREQKAIEDRKAANAEEAQRLKEAYAEGSSEAMRKVADEMAAAYEEKFGGGSLESYEGRIAGGEVAKEEIEAYKELEAYRKKAAEQAVREAEAEARAKEKAAQEAEHAAQQAAIAAQKAAVEEEKLARSRESAMVASKDAAGLEELSKKMAREANAKFGAWSAGKEASQEELDARLAAQRVANEAKSIRDAEQREADAAKREADRKARDRRRDMRERAVAMGDADWLEEEAKRAYAAADAKFGKENSWRDMSKAEWEMRQYAAGLMDDAKKARGDEETKAEEKKAKEDPWAVGVTAVRGMSVADVFNSMRGMGGATLAKDPNVDANQKTAKNTETMVQKMERIAQALSGEGVS